MKTVDQLTRTTFSGRRFTRKQLALVQEMAQMFENLSRKELAQTLCEQFNWITPKCKNKVNSCLTLLEGLEAEGVISLPAKRITKAPSRRPPTFKEPPPTSSIKGSLAEIGPITLRRITPKNREDWKAYLQTYHYLGYQHPMGCHLGYFIMSSAGQKLGCFLFSASAAWVLAPRDKWIGWEKQHRTKLLNLVLSNDRFLIFPWVDVPNLASHTLSLTTKQIGDDWLEIHGYRPVVIETFVDPTRYLGTCYRAANWHYLGLTQGRGRNDPKHECKETKKEIFVYPLQPDWQKCLTRTQSTPQTKKRYRNDLRASRKPVDDGLVNLWKKVVDLFHEVAQEYDEKWQVRKRVIDSTMLMLLIFRLVSSKNAQGYGTTIDDLWNNCRTLGHALPQESSIAPSSFCVARRKLDESAFKSLNRRIIETYAPQDAKYKWFGHRLFAVDGSKINLPRELIASGYKPSSPNVHYPQGLLSCLFQVKSQMPLDFDLVAHGDERGCAKRHLAVLEKGDVVVYDRGYYSYDLLRNHYKTGVHAIFRLQTSRIIPFREFAEGPQQESLITIYPTSTCLANLRKENPGINPDPLQMRLIKYEQAGKVYCLGTTLIEPHHHLSRQDFKDVYHDRWGVEELYKVSKRILEVQDFHARAERGVKQELFAHFALITMGRLFSNQVDCELNPDGNSPDTQSRPSELIKTAQERKTNFKNCIHVFARDLEKLLLLQWKIDGAVASTFNDIARRHQAVRPGRSYPRKSRRIISKWYYGSNKKKKTKKKSQKTTTTTQTT